MRWGEPRWWVGEVTEVQPCGMIWVKARARLYNSQWQQRLRGGASSDRGMDLYSKTTPPPSWPFWPRPATQTERQTDTHTLTHIRNHANIHTHTHTHTVHIACVILQSCRAHGLSGRKSPLQGNSGYKSKREEEALEAFLTHSSQKEKDGTLRKTQGPVTMSRTTF